MIKKTRYIVLLIAVGLASFLFYQELFVHKPQIILPPAQDYQNFVDKTPDLAVVTSTLSIPTTITNISPKQIVNQNNVSPDLPKDKINLNIPFTSQAPTANWVQPFEDACEEASILMVDYYYSKKIMPTKSAVEDILVAMVKWQEDNWGEHANLPLAKLTEYISLNYDYRPEIIADPSVDLIKKYLNQGWPIIVPANGKKLANPNFRNGGPTYHMLVIKGYVDDKFITNDPGTRLGADFIYTQENLMASIADWDGNKNGASGPKRILILHKI